jgi:phenylpropionate dioxygenase-like ring-hydroxylating dioxygenase large terminal subunit
MPFETDLKNSSFRAGMRYKDLRKTPIDPNFWYPIARSKDLKREKMMPVRFAGEPILLARSASDGVFALENRCAHRQVPLSAGVISGCSVKCGYHGWEYDSSGHCINVPYIDKSEKKPNGVRAYPVKEAYGLIFLFPGHDRLASQVSFPEIPSAVDSDYKTRYLNRQVGCHYSFMHENLMDMNHQFLHRRLMGGIRTIFLDVRTGDNWVEADYTFKRSSGRQPLGEKFMLGERPEKSVGQRDLMTIRTEYPYQTLKFWTAGSERPALDLWNVYIPVDREQETNHTFGLMMIRRPKVKVLLDVFWPIIIWFTNGIFAEDREICELEQAAFNRQGKDDNQEIFPAINSLRKVLRDNGLDEKI